jgi:tetratricopeptide (TPR) repeat protein
VKRLSIVLLSAALGCAASQPRPYQEARAAAERAYAAGRYDEASRHWLEAERHADEKRDRMEARYRAAAALRRAGRGSEAARLLSTIETDSPRGERAARAAYDRADVEIEQGDPEKGYAMLEALVHAHPRSGVARHALSRYLIWLDERGGSERVLGYLDGVKPRLDRTELAETLAFERGRWLERAGRREQALAQYLSVAARFPYPRGAHWDDALWNASLLDEQLGRPGAAIGHLRRMLSEMEPSHLQGSYQRPRYDDAQYRIAELYRDGIRDAGQARKEFRKVFDEHPTSVLRDDALWNEALLAKRQGDGAAACRALSLLVENLPDSRYAACTRPLCPGVAAKRDGQCRSYILRDVEGAR